MGRFSASTIVKVTHFFIFRALIQLLLLLNVTCFVPCLQVLQCGLCNSRQF
jgi:hypothetical protein